MAKKLSKCLNDTAMGSMRLIAPTAIPMRMMMRIKFSVAASMVSPIDCFQRFQVSLSYIISHKCSHTQNKGNPYG